MTSDYGNGLAFNNTPANVILKVGGQINGQWLNINNGGSIAVKGSVNASINLNGGGRVSVDPSISIAPLRQQLEAFSASLAAMPATGVIGIPTSQPGPIMINAVPNSRKIAIFNVDGTALFDNAKVQQIDINLNGADAVVINVTGNNVKFRQGNLVGAFNSQTVFSKVIWNFKDAVNVHVDRALAGTLLAPKAQVLVNAQVSGGIVSRSINQQAAIVTPGFLATAPFAAVSAKVDASVVQIKAAANGLHAFDTALVTRFNIAPVAAIGLSAVSVDPGAQVALASAASTDANGDALTFNWALLSKPAGSLAQISPPGSTRSVTPDKRGTYIVQLIARDGALASEPVTAVFAARNRIPAVTSIAPANGVTGAAYTYADTGSDADGDSLTWSLVSGPAGMTVNPATGAVAWIPSAAGSFAVVIKASDGYGGEATQAFSIVVAPGGNRFAPVIAPVANVTLHPGETADFSLSATDADGDVVTFWSPSLPVGASLNSASGAFSFTAGDTFGTIPAIFSATDGTLSASVTASITITPWPDTGSTRLSGRVLDAQDFANGLTTPVAGATIRIGSQTVTSGVDGSFSFNPLGVLGASASGPVAIAVDGSTATPAAGGTGYGAAITNTAVYRNGANQMAAPILVARRGGGALQLTTVPDKLPPSLRSCRILRADSAAGGTVALSSLALTAAEPLPAGTKISIWANSGQAGAYAIAGTASISANGLTLANITGSVPSGANIVVAPISLTGRESALQPKESYVPSLLGEGNLQTGFSTPSYISVGQNRAASFLYNSVTANPRPVITADVTIPADAALTAALSAELYVNGQKAPGVTVTRLDAAERPATSLPTENTAAIASISVSFDASALPTGAYPYELYVFAGHTCGAGAAKVTGKVFVNNRSASPYGSGWKPTELQKLFPQPDGSILIEELNGGLSEFDAQKAVGISPAPSLFDVFDPERADTGDIDNDGDIDIAIAEGKTGDVLIYKNAGPGTRQFAPVERIDAGENGVLTSGNEYNPDTNDVAIGDLNGDGLADLATAHQGLFNLRVWFGRLSGIFEQLDLFNRPTLTTDIGDIDGDGHDDVAFTYSSDLYIYFGPVTAASQPVSLGAGIYPYDIEIADLDHDGFDDIVVGDTFDASIIYGRADRSLLAPVLIDLPEGIKHGVLQQLVTTGDINGDGLMEIAIAGGTTFMVYGPAPDAPRLYKPVKRFTAPNGGEPESVAIRDFHGDGAAELFTVNKSSKLFVYDQDSIYAAKSPLEFDIAGSGDDTITMADFDQDGNQDLVLFFANPVTGSPDNMAVYFGTGDASAKFAAPAGDFSFFKKNPDGTFTRTYKDGSFVTFNAAGLQTAVTDANGNRTLYAYDAAGRVISITDPAGLVTASLYNAQGRLEKVTDPDGRMTVYSYDGSGRLASVTYPDGSSTIYDSDGKGYIISETDQRGQTVSHAYDAAGRLTQSTMPDGGTVKIGLARTLGLQRFGVNLGAPATSKYVAPADRVVRLADAKGNEAEQEVNEWGAIIRTTDPLGRTTRFDRDLNNLVTRITAPSDVVSGGLVTVLDYDGQGNVTSKREAVGTPLAREVNYEYEPVFNRVTRMTDAAGFITYYTYDAKGNLLLVGYPDNRYAANTYDSRGLKLTSTGERDLVTSYAYDLYGRLTTITDPQSVVQQVTMDSRGNVTASVDAFGTPLAQSSSQTFDSMNRVLTSVNGKGETLSFTYDAEGNILTSTDASGIAAARSYDAKGRLASLVDPSSGTTVPGYDLNDNITKVGAADGSETLMAYDAVNRVTQTTDALGIVRRVAYDSRDNIIAITDGRGSTTTFAYDALDRQVSRTNPAGNVWRFEYDARDLRVAVIKPDGTRVAFEHDSRARLVSAGVAGDALSQRLYGYGGFSQGSLLNAAVSAAGTPNAVYQGFQYDTRDQIVRQGQAAGAFGPEWNVDSLYDALGRRTLMSDSGGAITNYGYDPADRLTSVTAPSGRLIALAYDTAGRRTSVAYPNGLTTSAAFETPLAANGNTGRLTSIAHGLTGTGAAGSALNLKLGTFAYSYDVKGNIIAANENAGLSAPPLSGEPLAGTPAKIRAYTLDAIERLTSVKDGGGASLESYSLDAEGNRVVSHKSSFHVTDAANRLQEDEKHQFEYDVNGNMVRKTVKASGLTWRYGYTVYDELAAASRHASADPASPALEKAAYVFDAFGRRIAERRFDAANALTGGTNFHYDGEEAAHEADLNASGAVTGQRWTTHSDGVDDLLAVTLQAGAGPSSPTAFLSGPSAPSNVSYYYHTDHQGSVRAITDQSGAVTNSYAYDSYGTAQESVESLAQRFRYTGREYDALTGLYHYRARAYDPETARFLQEDPLWFEAGDLNVYRMTWNNPVNWVDPSGMSAAGEQTQVDNIGTRSAGAIAGIGQRLGCMFATFAGAVSVAGDLAAAIGYIDPVYADIAGTISDAGAVMGCGVKLSKTKKRFDPCTGKDVLSKVDFLFSVFGGLKTLNSFAAGTPVLTPDGLKPIEEIAVGDLVAARDEVSGGNVWRKVTETYNRLAPATLDVSLANQKGDISIVHVTIEHPFHLQDWDGKVETLVAALTEAPTIDAARLFPTDGRTRFGDWVKAGALKIGDHVSSRDSTNEAGPRAKTAANDNQPLTVTEIIRDSRTARVYNFEVESRSGEITHNYFVGDDAAWVHNAGFGNARNSSKLAWLYRLYDARGRFLKWGVTNNPAKRYPKSCNFDLRVQACGCRSDMLDMEREMVGSDPGPINFEPWAGSLLP